MTAVYQLRAYEGNIELFPTHTSTVNYIMKCILPDAESREEHDAIHKKIMQLRAAKLWTFLRPSAIKITEKGRKFTIQAIVKKANRLARFND